MEIQNFKVEDGIASCEIKQDHADDNDGYLLTELLKRNPNCEEFRKAGGGAVRAKISSASGQSHEKIFHVAKLNEHDLLVLADN